MPIIDPSAKEPVSPINILAGYVLNIKKLTSDPTIENITKDTTYKATYNKTKNKYTVTWKNYDGTILEIDENMEYGIMPSYEGNTPTKAKDAEYTYTFDNWDKEISNVTGNVTYTATYKSNKRICN